MENWSQIQYQNSLISKTPLATTSNLEILISLVELFGYYKKYKQGNNRLRAL